MSSNTSINPATKFLKYIYEDDMGFNSFTVTFSSEIIETPVGSRYNKKIYPEGLMK
jgi:hypothetical protein